MQVLLTDDDPDDALPFVYIGSSDNDDAWALNFLGNLQRTRGAAFQHGELVSLGGTWPVKLMDAGPIGREEYAVQVGAYYGTERYTVMQVLICDPAGRYPDDPECEEVYRSLQPILSFFKN